MVALTWLMAPIVAASVVRGLYQRTPGKQGPPRWMPRLHVCWRAPSRLRREGGEDGCAFSLAALSPSATWGCQRKSTAMMRGDGGAVAAPLFAVALFSKSAIRGHETNDKTQGNRANRDQRRMERGSGIDLPGRSRLCAHQACSQDATEGRWANIGGHGLRQKVLGVLRLLARAFAQNEDRGNKTTQCAIGSWYVTRVLAYM